MKRVIALAALAILTTGSAWASASCTAAPKAQWKSEADLKALLTTEGMTVRQIKIEKGCYEVYATDNSGKRVNLAYNAETLEKLADPEAGEN